MATLGDDIESANAIDSMVWYFYKAAYDPTKYKTPGPPLHAQVVTIADKNVCPSLYNLAKTLFAKTTKTIESEDRAAVAAFLYEQTSTEVLAHMELRNLVITALTGHPSVLQSTLQNDSVVELLRSNEDLATDLLIAMRTKNCHNTFPYATVASTLIAELPIVRILRPPTPGVIKPVRAVGMNQGQYPNDTHTRLARCRLSLTLPTIYSTLRLPSLSLSVSSKL